MKNSFRERIHERYGEVDAQFVEDVLTFFEQFNDYRYITKPISKSLVSLFACRYTV